MLLEDNFTTKPHGLEESTRPATLPVEPQRPAQRADYLWLASGDHVTAIGESAPNEGWRSELQKLADLLGPHLREGAECTFELHDGYSVVCVATSVGWLMAVGVQGQDVRDLRRDALVMARRAAMAGSLESAASAQSDAPTFAELAPQLNSKIILEGTEIAVAKRLWGTIGPLLLNHHGEFELMAHVDPNEPLVDFDQQWNSWTHRMHLATDLQLPTVSELRGS